MLFAMVSEITNLRRRPGFLPTDVYGTACHIAAQVASSTPLRSAIALAAPSRTGFRDAGD